MINTEKLIAPLADHYGYQEFIDDVSNPIKEDIVTYPKIPNPVTKEDFVEDKIYDYLIGIANTSIVTKVQMEAAKTAPIITKEEVKYPEEPIKITK